MPSPILSHWIDLKKNSRKFLFPALGIIALILILQLGKYFRTPTPPQKLIRILSGGMILFLLF